MTARWWLSFADPARPEGEQFLGVCIVRASDMVSAVKLCHALKINPGGEVAGMPVDEAAACRISFSLADYMGRLLSPREARELDARIDAELLS